MRAQGGLYHARVGTRGCRADALTALLRAKPRPADRARVRPQAEYASSAPKGELRHSLAVQGYDEGGFVLSGGQRVAGALLCAADVTAGWAPEAPGEVTPDHLKLLELVWPPVETLVVGTGEVAAHDALPAATKEYLHSRGITMDVRPTPSAAYTFGVLREEGRAVAAALFPMGKGSMDGGRSGIYSDARG